MRKDTKKAFRISISILLIVIGLMMMVFSRGAHAEIIADLKDFPKWTSVMERENVRAALAPYKGEIKPLLVGVHKKWRKFTYMEDAQNYGKDDYWATRAEMVFKEAGDCEDFAIAEYFDLLELGVAEPTMGIVVVIVRQTQEIHAVLQVEGWILDSRSEKVMPLSEAASYYLGIYRINRMGYERM